MSYFDVDILFSKLKVKSGPGGAVSDHEPRGARLRAAGHCSRGEPGQLATVATDGLDTSAVFRTLDTIKQ